jgi:hypothetical protein
MMKATLSAALLVPFLALAGCAEESTDDTEVESTEEAAQPLGGAECLDPNCGAPEEVHP